MPPPDVPVASMPAVPALVDRVEATSGAVVKGTRRAVDAAVDLLW